MTARVLRGVCPSGKTRYRNRRAALAGRSKVFNDRHRLGQEQPELWIYRCRQLCGGWHLTSQPPR